MQAISVEMPIPSADIRAVAALGTSLWIADTDGKITKCIPNTDSIAKPFSISTQNPIYEENYNVISMCAATVTNQLFALLRSKDGISSKIIKFNDNGETSEYVTGVGLLAVSPPGSRRDSIVYTKGTTFCYNIISENDEQIKPEFVDCITHIDYIACNDVGVAFYSNSMYKLWYRDTKHFVNVSSCSLPHGMIIPTSDSFVFCMNSIISMSADEGMSMSNPVPLSMSLTGTKDPPVGGCFFGENLILFYPSRALSCKMSYSHHDSFVPRNLPSITTFVYYGDVVYFISDYGAYQMGGMTDGMKLANKAASDGIKIAINQAKSFKPERLKACLIDFFKTLWEKEKYADALDVVSTFLWEEDVKEILSLFPFFVFQGAKKQRTILPSLAQYTGDSLEVFEKLGAFLTFTHGEYIYSHDKKITMQLPILETALFEFYAVFHQTRDIDALLSEENAVVGQSVALFFNENLAKRKLHPALAVYFTHTEKTTEALTIWKSLNDSDKKSTKWAFEAAYTLQKVQDKKTIEDNLVWICARSKSAAVQTFLHPDVDIQDATKWIKKNAEHFMIKFLDYLTKIQKANTKLSKEALDLFSKALRELGTPEFRSKYYTFSKYYEKWKKTPPKASELEETEIYICTRILEIAKENTKIDLLPYCKTAQETGHIDLMLNLFIAGELYAEAMQEFVCTWKIDYQKIQTFCRSCINPSVAFRFAVEKLMAEGQNILATQKSFILDNIEYIAYDDILRWLPDNVPFSEVVDIFNAMERINVMKRNILLTQKSTLESLKTEIEYKLMKQEVRWVEVTYDTACESCKRPVGNGFVSISKEGNVYHLACKPREYPK